VKPQARLRVARANLVVEKVTTGRDCGIAGRRALSYIPFFSSQLLLVVACDVFNGGKSAKEPDVVLGGEVERRG
jgi:hypothetical protein